MSDNELTISDYYDVYPIMRYILPGLVYNNGAAPQKNISNNAFILRQGAWILSKILDDEHTEYGYETFHPAQRYTLGDVSSAVSVDQNKFNTMMMKRDIIRSNIRGLGSTISVNWGRGPVNISNMPSDIITINGIYSARGIRTDNTPINVCGIDRVTIGQNTPPGFCANMLNRYKNICEEIIFRDIMYDHYLKEYSLKTIYNFIDNPRIIFPFTMMRNDPANMGRYDQNQLDAIINELCNSITAFYNYMRIKFMSNPYDLPFYVIFSLISGIIEIAGFININVGNAPFPNFSGNVIIQIIEDAILSDTFWNFLINLLTKNFDMGMNARKNVFFNYLTNTAINNTAIGLYVPLSGQPGSFIVPYTDYEERSESSGGNLIDNRDLLDRVHAGAEPKISQNGDRIRNGRKGDHIATVLTSDDIRLLAIFLQLAVENFNASAARTLYNSRNDIIYKDYTKGLRNPGTIGSYFDHLIALRETDDDVRKGS